MGYHRRYQHFALDDEGSIVSIWDTKGLGVQHYICPYCRNEMIAKRGAIRQWHFAHKVKQCSYDKYLHSIAEIAIGEWFSKSESIILDMEVVEKCPQYDGCVFHNDVNCKGGGRRRFNLKKYYTRCIPEHRYGGFVADLYCERNGFDEGSPIFIEICVTHECSQEKVHSGIRIIELVIKSEGDIQAITASKTLKEGDCVRLYNFKRREVLVDRFVQPMQKFILYPSLKSYVERELYTCKNFDKYRKGMYEINTTFYDWYPYFIFNGGFNGMGKIKAHVDGYLHQDCCFCRWQAEDRSGERFCKLYKKCGNPKFCKENDALQCSMFREDAIVVKRASFEFEEYSKDNYVEVWKRSDEKMVEKFGG